MNQFESGPSGGEKSEEPSDAIQVEDYAPRVSEEAIIDYYITTARDFTGDVSGEKLLSSLWEDTFAKEDIAAIRDILTRTGAREGTQREEIAAIIRRAIAQEQVLVAKIKEVAQEFAEANYAHMRDFLKLGDEKRPPLHFSIVSEIVRMAERHILEEYGAEAGRYMYETNSAFAVANTRRPERGEDDYVRTTAHELFHALSTTEEKVGFRMKEGDSGGSLGMSFLNETMTECVTQKFLEQHYPEKVFPFNEEYLREVGFVKALEALVGWDALRDAYAKSGGAEKLLELLAAKRSDHTVLDLKILEQIHITLGGKLDTSELIGLLEGKRTVINLTDPRMADVDREEIDAISQRLKNLTYEK